PGARVVLRSRGRTLHEAAVDLAPGKPYVHQTVVEPAPEPSECELAVEHEGETLVSWRPRPPHETDEDEPVEPAAEPPPPSGIDSVDELYLTGLHLSQYRHATRKPEPYWEEALRRDPGDARCN